MRTPVRRVVLAAFGLLLACAVLVCDASSPGQATSGWLAPETLPARGPSPEDGHVALDARGNALAVWVARSGDSSVVKASWRPAGGGWQPAVDLSSPGYVAQPHVSLMPRADASCCGSPSPRVATPR